MKKSIVAFSMIALVFTSCKKEDKALTPTKENLAGTYKITAQTAAGVNVFNNADENMNFLDACERDDLHKLNANETYDIVDAGTACNPSSASQGSWKLTSNTTMEIEGESASIKSWDGTTLVTEYDFGGGNKLTTTMVKQ